MSRMHYLVGVNHFAEYGTKRPLIVWEMLRNIQKFSIPQWWKNMKSDMESARGSGSPPKLITSRGSPCPCLSSLVVIRFRVRQLSCLQNDRTNDRQSDHITSASSAEVVTNYDRRQFIIAITHSLVDLPRWGLATADDHSDIFLLHCSRSCDISFSWMYSHQSTLQCRVSTVFSVCLDAVTLPWFLLGL